MIGTAERTPSLTPAEEPSSTQAIGIKPRRVVLVESWKTGLRYLRAYDGGHFYWQPVAGTPGALVDTGIWRTGADYHQDYWLNLGPYRRRANRYVAVDAHGTADRVA